MKFASFWFQVFTGDIWYHPQKIHFQIIKVPGFFSPCWLPTYPLKSHQITQKNTRIWMYGIIISPEKFGRLGRVPIHSPWFQSWPLHNSSTKHHKHIHENDHCWTVGQIILLMLGKSPFLLGKHTLWPGSAGSPVQSAASPADAVKLRPGDAKPAAVLTRLFLTQVTVEILFLYDKS